MATLSTATLTVGSHVITVAYLPSNANFRGTSSGANAAPTATITTPASGSLNQAGVAFTFNGTATDQDAGTIFTAAWSFDTVNVLSDVSGGALTKTYSFSAAGVYSVKLTVNDKVGGVTIADTVGGAQDYVVVYDPNAGFVTGGGYIVPPDGAYTPGTGFGLPPVPSTVTADNNKAHFGFVSQYKKGATTPTGETEFFYQAGDFKFKSTVYDWLVVGGKRAQYKGSGTVNGGTRQFGFLLTAIDGSLATQPEPDSFRMKIWDKTTGTVVYDSGLGGPDDIDASPTTPIAPGGSIVIHTNNGNK